MIVISGLSVSCKHHRGAKEGEFVINGELKGGDGLKVFLYEIIPSKSILIDSSKADISGEFRLTDKIKEPGIYDLKINKNNFLRLLIDKGETIDITGDSKYLSKSYTIKGSPGSELIKQINEKYYSTIIKIDSLNKLYMNSRNNPEFVQIKVAIDSAYKKILNNEKKYLQDFIVKNKASLVSIIAIYQKLGRQDMFVMNDPNDFKYFEKVDSNLMAKYPENKHTSEFHKNISEFKREEAERQLASKQIEPGATPPDISLPNPEGKIINLYSLKGKVVLLDFWASWCKPCRAENPHLVKLYNIYKNKGFEIYGVSFDREKDDWIAGIKKDKITWIQVSDLKYWSSPIAKEFNVEEIPYSILISREGKIVEKGMMGNELENKIREELRIRN